MLLMWGCLVIDLSFKGSAFILICLVNKVISAWFNLLVVLLRPPTAIKKLSSHICGTILQEL